MAITRLSGGSTPADGSDPRTSPAIWNPTADVIDANETDIAALQALVGDNNLNDINDVAITAPADGEFLVYDNGDWVNAEAAPPAILQVVSVTKTDPFTTNNTSYTDVTGLSATITPTSATSSILVIARLALNNGTASAASRGQMVRDSTPIGGGDAASTRPSGSFYAYGPSGATGHRTGYLPQSFVHLDSPATTSATTYKIQVAGTSGTTTTVNRSAGDDVDSIDWPRMASTITLMEVAG